ncbi:hypothetical protein DNK49_14570 [Azoarcus communis]|uniref:Uncharacterized protein n=2 Tax=Parazoarcus communis TaxID=41977 RepID=A0A323UTV8_9RHOO|nr:hypothetical protein DNK49_14570 [Azoarcus communis] [Parazoarcus communis SWub3 = DSM 12120]
MHTDSRSVYMAKVARIHSASAKIMSFCAILASTGCAQLLSKWNLSIPEKLVVQERKQVEGTSRKPIIVVRWPAILDKKAHDSIVNIQYAYVKQVTGNDLRGIVDYTQLPELLPYATTFYAADLYFAIRRAYPEAIVLLEPTLLQGASRNRIIDRPLADISIPIDLVADITVDQSATHSALVSGAFYFSLRGSPGLSTNCGVYVAMEYNFPKGEEVNSSRCTSFSAHDTPFSMWWSGTSYRSDKWLLKISDALPASTSYTLRYPLLSEANHGAFSATVPPYVAQDRPASPAEAQNAPLQPYIENFGKTIALAAQFIPVSRENGKALAEYTAYFDKQLSDALRTGATLTTAEEVNLKFIRRILDSELLVRAKHDEEVARQISAGDFGQAFRDVRLQMYAEYGKKMQRTWTSVVGAVALHGALLENSKTPTALVGAENATVDQFNSELAAQGRDYYKSIAPMIAELDSAAVDVGNRLVTIRTNDQAALRAALVNVYKTNSVAEKPHPLEDGKQKVKKK